MSSSSSSSSSSRNRARMMWKRQGVAAARGRIRLAARVAVLETLEARRLLCVPGEEHEIPDPDSPPGAPGPQGATHPLVVPSLSSRPGSQNTIYLDLDGTPQFDWYGQTVPVQPPHNQDGDATTFSDAELEAITRVWQGAAEKFSPFDINVTTVDPGTPGTGYHIRVVFFTNIPWAYGAGWAYVNVPGTVFAINYSSGGISADYMSYIAAHEAGHSLGLWHQ